MELSLSAGMFVLTVLGQFILARTALPGSGVMKYAALIVVFGLSLLTILSAGLGTDWFTMSACILAYGFACELYLFLFTMVSSSVSVKLLRTLWRGETNLADIEEIYDSTGMVSRRLERLRRVGLLENGADRVTFKGKVLVWAFTFLKKAFRHQKAAPGSVPARRAA